MAPDSGKTVRLQFLLYRQCVDGCLRFTRAGLTYFLADAQQVLHVMADFVSDDVSLRKVTGRAELLAHVVKEREIQIDLIVAGAIKRANRRAGGAARGIDAIGKQHQARLLIGFTGGAE